MRLSLPADPGRPPLRSAVAYLSWLARRQLGVLTGAIVCGIVAGVAQAALPFLLGRAIDEAIATGVREALVAWCAVLLGVGLVQAAAGVVGHRLDVAAWLRAALGSARLVGHHVSRTGEAIRTAMPTGEVVSAVANDALRMGDVFAGAARFVGGIVAYGAVTAVLWSISPTLGWAVLVALPVVAGVLALLVRPLQRRQTTQREVSGRLATYGSDTVAGLRILRGIGGEDAFVQRYREQSQAVRHAGIHVARTQSVLDAMQALLPGALLVGVVWFGAHLARTGQVTPGQLVAIYGYVAYLTEPLRAATETANAVSRAVVAARRILAVLGVRPTVRSGARTAPLPAGPAPLVDQVSGLVVRPGRLTALVGADPDATARIATRLGRFDDEAEAGTPVLLGDVRLAQAAVDEIRSRIVVSEATPHLFTGRLADELDVRGDATRASLKSALDIADAGDVLTSVPDGLDGEIAEQGRSLSGGQRQRVALARALLTQADTLVLVEPTSAVDAHTEARIAARLARARTGRTTLVVTASPLVLDAVDEVVLVRDGVVVATGAHAELWRRGDAEGAAYRAVVTRASADEQERSRDDVEPEPTPTAAARAAAPSTALSPTTLCDVTEGGRP